LLDIIAKNTQQKSPVIEINGRELVQPFTWYTCPVGKIATVKGKVTCTGTGAASEARFSVAGVILLRWQAFVVGDVFREFAYPDDMNQIRTSAGNLRNTPINILRKFDVTLSAGQTIVTSQNSGTNAEFNVFAEVNELPA